MRGGQRAEDSKEHRADDGGALGGGVDLWGGQAMVRGMRTQRWKLGAAVGAVITAAGLAAACTPTGIAIGAGATVATAAQEERGLDGNALDVLIEGGIATRFFEENERLLTAIEVTVFERRVLLMGVVEDQALADAAVRLAWRSPDVVEVLNEIVVRDGGADTVDTARDALIASELRSQLLFDGKIRSINYSIDVVDRTVYVMGVARDRAELQRVLGWARNTDYVRRVVNHALLRDDPRRAAPGEAVYREE